MNKGYSNKKRGIETANAQIKVTVLINRTIRIIVQIKFHGATIKYSKGIKIHHIIGNRIASNNKFQGNNKIFKGNISHTIYTLGLYAYLFKDDTSYISLFVYIVIKKLNIYILNK